MTRYPPISLHFGGSECTVGASQRNMDLGPLPPGVLSRMTALAGEVLEPWRTRVGALKVNRWWVNEELNRQQGGVANSQHLLGEAIDVVSLQMDLRLAFEMLVHNGFIFDQAILYPHRGFIHVSFKSGDRADRYGNRSHALFSSARDKNDSKRYHPYDEYSEYLVDRNRYLSRKKA